MLKILFPPLNFSGNPISSVTFAVVETEVIGVAPLSVTVPEPARVTAAAVPPTVFVKLIALDTVVTRSLVDELTEALPVNANDVTLAPASPVDQLPLVLQRLSAPPPVHV